MAQLPNGGQNHADILKFMSELPPDGMKKIERVGKLLQEDLRQGKLTQAQIGEELASGNLEQTLRQLNPEAGPLLDDIAQTMKDHPHAGNLSTLLDGLIGHR
jgi:hypothetical protein